MAITSGFHNSINGDRKYGADFFALFFGTLIANGVFPNPSTGLQVTANSNMTTSAKAGKGWINGYFIVNDGDYVLKHDNADGLLKRIDRVVMKLNHVKREIEVLIKKGTFASSPVAPTLQRDTDAYELALADVLINNGTTQITQSNITDQRLNTSLCGIVHGTVNQVDTTTLFNQYLTWYNETTTNATKQMTAWQKQTEEDFMEWFNSIQDILDENVAANLANRIATLELQSTQQTSDLKAHVDDVDRHNNYGVATGTNSLMVTLSPAPKALKAGFSVRFKNTTANTGAMTLNVNGLGVKSIKRNGNTDVLAGEMKAGGVYTVCYDGSAFILQGEGGVNLGDKIPNSRVTAGWRSQWVQSPATYGGSYRPVVDKDGNLYMINGPDNRNGYTTTLVKYSKTGTLIKQVTVGSAGSNQPSGLSISPNGNHLAFTTGGMHSTNIQLYTTDLNPVRAIPMGNGYTHAGKSVAVTDKGDVYIILRKYNSESADGNELKKYANAGYQMWVKLFDRETLVDLILLSDGNVAVASDYGGMKVHKITGTDISSNVSTMWSYLTNANATNMGNIVEMTNGDIAVSYALGTGDGRRICYVQAIMTNGTARPGSYISLGGRLGTQYMGVAIICSDGNGGLYFGFSGGSFYWGTMQNATIGSPVKFLIYGRLLAGNFDLGWCHIYTQNEYAYSDTISAITYDPLTDSVISTHSDGPYGTGTIRKWDWFVSLK
ncbi:hypothetical protein [Lysinibacillus fusiformis]|uniref:hypothetical protein n=1 Tax=Lysinibacillus fusiformis TaxID=28031 RepID=UPI003D05C37E